MLLPSNFQSRKFDKVTLEVEIQILNIRINFKAGMILLAFNLRSRYKKFFGDFLSDNACLSKHQNMSFVDIENCVVRAS